MSDLVQTNVLLGPEDRDRLGRLEDRHGYNKSASVRRGLRALDRLLAYYERRAREQDEETGRLMLRVARELGPEWLADWKLIAPGETAHAGPGIVARGLVYFEDDGGRLLATNEKGEIYAVEKNGYLTLSAVVFPEQVSAN